MFAVERAQRLCTYVLSCAHCCYYHNPHEQDAQNGDCVTIPDYVHDIAPPYIFLVLYRTGLFVFITGPSVGNMPRPINVDQDQTSENFRVE